MNPFGVEIEFEKAPYKKVAMGLRNASLNWPLNVSKNMDFQPSSNGRVHHLKWDYSVSEEIDGIMCGGEVATAKFPCWSSKVRRDIETIHTVILENGGQFNCNTGLHIHVDVTDVDRMKLIAMWFMYEEQLFRIVSESRKNGDYTRNFYYTSFRNKDLSIQDKLSKYLSENSIYEMFGTKNSIFRFYERGRGKNERIIWECRLGQVKDDLTFITAWIKTVLAIVASTNKHRDVLSILYADECDTLEFLISDLGTKSLKLTAEERAILWDKCETLKVDT